MLICVTAYTENNATYHEQQVDLSCYQVGDAVLNAFYKLRGKEHQITHDDVSILVRFTQDT